METKIRPTSPDEIPYCGDGVEAGRGVRRKVGRPRLLVVGDCPHRFEARYRHPFVGPSGRRLLRLFGSDAAVSPACRRRYWEAKGIAFVNVHKGFRHVRAGAPAESVGRGLCVGCSRDGRPRCREKVPNPSVGAVVRRHGGPVLVLGEAAFRALRVLRVGEDACWSLDWKEAVRREAPGERVLVAFHPSPRNAAFTRDEERVARWLRAKGLGEGCEGG